MIIKRQLLNAAKQAVTGEDTRYYLSAVQVQPDGALESTNGHLALILTDTSAGYQDPDFPKVEGAGKATKITKPVLVPADMIERLVKGTARKATIPILQTVQVTRDEAKKATVLVSTDLSVPTVVTLKDETVEGLGTFPTLEKVKPKWDKKTKTLKVRLSAEVLTVLIKAVMALRSEGKATRNTSLDFEFRVPEGEKPVEDQFWVRSEYDGLKMEAIVMPMRV